MAAGSITLITEWGNRILDWFYPPHCYHCGRFLGKSEERTLCPPCRDWLRSRRIQAPMCKVCGLALQGTDGAGTCISCRALRPTFERARAFFPYSGPAASLVRSYKYQGNYFLGPKLLRWAIHEGWLPDDLESCDCVVPVPLHRRRKAERGYNQADLLARVVAAHADIPLLRRALVRERHTDQQARLTRPRRRENVRGAFRAGRQDTSGQRVLLMDDVMTTGATAGECARALKKSGAAEVHVLTLVRAGK